MLIICYFVGYNFQTKGIYSFFILRNDRLNKAFVND